MGAAVRRAGLEGVTFHGLRHSAASFMIGDGADAYLIMRRFGHKDVSATYNL